MVVNWLCVSIVGLITAPLLGCAALVEQSPNQAAQLNNIGQVAGTNLGAAIGPALSSNYSGNSDENPSNDRHGYRIAALDTLDVSVFRVPELSRTVRVAQSGTINLPLVGELHAAGRTVHDLKQELTNKLDAKFLQQSEVTIFVKDYTTRKVTLEGAVQVPGVYPLRGGMSLLQLIAMARGLRDTADNDVTILRQVHQKRVATRFNLSFIRSGTDDDPALVAGDVVIVSKSPWKDGLKNFLSLLPIAGTIAAF